MQKKRLIIANPSIQTFSYSLRKNSSWGARDKGIVSVHEEMRGGPQMRPSLERTSKKYVITRNICNQSHESCQWSTKFFSWSLRETLRILLIFCRTTRRIHPSHGRKSTGRNWDWRVIYSCGAMLVISWHACLTRVSFSATCESCILRKKKCEVDRREYPVLVNPRFTMRK